MNAHAKISGAAPVRAEAPNETTKIAQADTLLTPRFYTTDFDKLDKVDVSGVRREWDALIAEMKSDPNRGHFRRDENWDKIELEDLPEGLRKEFVDFLARVEPVLFAAQEHSVAGQATILVDVFADQPPEIHPAAFKCLQRLLQCV